jgi:hypothetical protein
MLAASPVLIIYNYKKEPKGPVYADIFATASPIIVIFSFVKDAGGQLLLENFSYRLCEGGEWAKNALDLKSCVIPLQSPQCRICGSY